MTTEERGWLERASTGAADNAGAVLRAWRDAADGTQVDVAAMLGTSQQHLSQMEKGQRPISLEQRRLMVTELGIAAEDLGLSSEHSPPHSHPTDSMILKSATVEAEREAS